MRRRDATANLASSWQALWPRVPLLQRVPRACVRLLCAQLITYASPKACALLDRNPLACAAATAAAYYKI